MASYTFVILLLVVLYPHLLQTKSSCKPCNSPLGIENGQINDSQMIAMNSYNNDPVLYGAHHGRLHAKTGYRARKNKSQTAWITIDFERPLVLSEISTQGYGDPRVSEWVTEFKLFYAFGDNNTNYKPMKDSLGNEMIFIANKDRSSVRQNKMPLPVIASKIMLIPVKWHDNVGLRMEVYGCEPGYSFNVWLMLARKPFYIEYLNNTSVSYINNADEIMSEVTAQMEFTYGFLYATLIRFSPHSHPQTMQTDVVAEIKIHCLPQKEELLAGKLDIIRKNTPEKIDSSFFELQYTDKCDCPPPKVQIKGLSKSIQNPTKVYKTNKALYKVLSVFSGKCDTKIKLISWEITYITKKVLKFYPMITSETITVKNSSSYNVVLQRDAKLLYVRCKVQMIRSQGAIGYDYGFLKVVIPELVAKISGKQKVRKNDDIILDGLGSFDPIFKFLGPRFLRFHWSCKRKPSNMPLENTIGKLQECSKSTPNNGRKGKTLRVKTNQLEAGDYIFSLKVSKQNRRTTAHFKVTLLPATVLTIRCVLCSRRISTNSTITFNVTCQGNDCYSNHTYQWVVYRQRFSGSWVQVKNLSTSVTNNGVEFSIQSPAELIMGNNNGNDHFKAEVIRRTDDGIAKHSIPFIINGGPRLLNKTGGCYISPSSGIGVSTIFHIWCKGWHDEDLPLIYQFNYHESFGTVIFHSGYQSFKNTTLPPGREDSDFNLKLQVSIKDSKGSETMLDLIAKVRPSYDLDDFQKRYKNFTLTASKLVKEGWVDQTAENALSLIQTAEKVLPNVDQVQLKDTVLTSIQGINLKTVPQITKVVAIVALATNRSENLGHRARKESLNLLDKSLKTMDELQEAEKFDDLEIAKNITTTLMMGIGRVISSSIVEQDPYSKNDTKKALKIAERVADTLLALKRIGDPPSVIKTRTIDIMVYRAKPEDVGGKDITEGDAGVKLPSKDVLFGNNSNVPFVDFQMIKHTNNPYTWDPKSSFIRSGVLDVTLKQKSKKMEISNLENPVSLSIPKDPMQIIPTKPEESFFIKPSNGSTNFRYHPFNIESDSHTVVFEVIPAEGQSLEVFVRAVERPTDTKFNFTTTVPEVSSCDNSTDINCFHPNYKITITSKLTGMTGLHYLGLRFLQDTTITDNEILVRKRRDCTSSSGRQKRSCVGVKDPPTTPPPTPVTVVPIYNPLTDINYTLTSTVSFCGYWNEEEEQWTSMGCKVDHNNIGKQIACLCNHLSAFGGDFFVAPNPIDFDKVFMEFGRLGETGNYVVLSTVCLLWALYLIGLVIARKADKNDKNKIIIQVIPSDDESAYCYKISIETGMWYGNGTTADVTINMYGTEGCSGPLYLNNPNSEKRFFSRSSINVFYVSLPQSLGQLNKIKVQHNNGGSNPSWYLKDVFIVDIQSGSKAHFVADRWIAVHRNDGKLECTLEGTKEKGAIPFKSAFHSRMSKKLGESHLWVSLFSRPPQNPFTRCQRLSCCISVLFAAMVTSAMFYRFGIESKDTIHIGSFKISWTEIKIGIQSALIAFPVNILIVTMFKNIKQPRTESDLDVEQDIKTPGILPSFFIYITWVLCIAVALVSSTFVVFYSLTWGASTSNQWLKSIMISFFQDSLVIQPIKIIGIAFLLSMIFRRADDHEAVLDIPTVNNNSTAPQSNDSPSPEEIEESRSIKSKGVRLSIALTEMVLFFVFVLLLVLVVYGNRGVARFQITSHLEETFDHFQLIKNQSMFWSWAKEDFLRSVYNATWYNQQPFRGPEGYISSRSMFLVGMPRIRQIRVKPDYTCLGILNMVQMLHLKRCIHYSANNEETSKYNWMDWTPMSNVSIFQSGFQLRDLCPIPWRYKTARELQTLPISGKFKYYYGGGYVADLGYNLKTAKDVISKLENNSWLDSLTAAVLTEFTVFEPSSQLFSVVKLLYERLPTGGVNIVPSFQTIPVYFRNTGSNIANICQPLFMLVVLLLFNLELVRLFFQKCSYLKDFWNWLTLCQCFGSMAIVVIFFCKQKFASAYVKKVHENPYQTTSCDLLILWTDIEMYSISFVMFVTTVKCLRLFRFVPEICQMTNTLRASAKFLCSHISSFVIVILAFTQLASTVFGSVIPTYATFVGTVSSLLQQLVGGRFYFTSVRSVDPVLGPIFTFSYIFISTVVLVNMFVAILNETYASIRYEHANKNFDDAELGEFLISMLKQLNKDSRAKLWKNIKSLTFGRKGKYDVQSKAEQSNQSKKPSKSKKFGLPRMKLFKSQSGSYDFRTIDRGDGYRYQVIPQEILLVPEYSDNIIGISYKPFKMHDVIQYDCETTKNNKACPRLACEKNNNNFLSVGPTLATFDSERSLNLGSTMDVNYKTENRLKRVDCEIDYVKKSFEDIRGDLMSLSTLTLTSNNDSAYGNGSPYWDDFSDPESDHSIKYIYHL